MQVASIYSVAGIYSVKKVADNRVVTLPWVFLCGLKIIRITYNVWKQALVTNRILSILLTTKFKLDLVWLL